MDLHLRAVRRRTASRCRSDELPTTQAVRNGRPAHAVFRIRSASGDEHEIEASAFPIVASEEGSSGAMIFFWPLQANGGEEARR